MALQPGRSSRRSPATPTTTAAFSDDHCDPQPATRVQRLATTTSRDRGHPNQASGSREQTAPRCARAGSRPRRVEHLRKLNARPAGRWHWVGFDLDERARVGNGQMPAAGWEAALDAAGMARDDAQVAELTRLLREGPTATGSTAGRPTCASWCGGRRSSTRRNCHCSSRSTATATRSSRPPPGADR